MLERVVRRRRGVLVPPVAADQPVVAEPDARIRRDSVHRRGETVAPDRRGPVALAMV